MALLVFQRWAVYLQKPNVPFVRLAFYNEAQRSNIRIAHIRQYPHCVYPNLDCQNN
jgi:hypothetical protein